MHSVRFQSGTSDVVIYVASFGASFYTVFTFYNMCLDDIYFG